MQRSPGRNRSEWSPPAASSQLKARRRRGGLQWLAASPGRIAVGVVGNVGSPGDRDATHAQRLRQWTTAAAQRSTAQHSTAQHSTAQHSNEQSSAQPAPGGSMPRRTYREGRVRGLRLAAQKHGLLPFISVSTVTQHTQCELFRVILGAVVQWAARFSDGEGATPRLAAVAHCVPSCPPVLSLRVVDSPSLLLLLQSSVSTAPRPGHPSGLSQCSNPDGTHPSSLRCCSHVGSLQRKSGFCP